MTVKPWLEQWQPLSARLGRQELRYPIVLRNLSDPAVVWYSRHRLSTALFLMIDDLLPEAGLDRCRCKNGVTEHQPSFSDPEISRALCVCVQRITQEDALCDECRLWCKR